MEITPLSWVGFTAVPGGLHKLLKFPQGHFMVRNQKVLADVDFVDGYFIFIMLQAAPLEFSRFNPYKRSRDRLPGGKPAR